jgi:hypothetical protein
MQAYNTLANVAHLPPRSPQCPTRTRKKSKEGMLAADVVGSRAGTLNAFLNGLALPFVCMCGDSFQPVFSSLQHVLSYKVLRPASSMCGIPLHVQWGGRASGLALCLHLSVQSVLHGTTDTDSQSHGLNLHGFTWAPHR